MSPLTPSLTPSQTIGPFYHHALLWADGPEVVAPGTPGAIRIHGRILDGAGAPVADGLVETWQADSDGGFDHPDDPRGTPGGTAGGTAGGGFRGFGRCPTDETGSWSITTLKPGREPGADGRLQAPHVDVSLYARGLLNRLVTRIYFSDEADANAEDALLTGVEPDRRATLVATREDDGYRFDIVLQGERSTVFFAL